MADLTAEDMKVMEEVSQMLKTEPTGGGNSAQPDIPVLHEQLAILVSTGKAMEAIGVQLTQEHVKHLEAKDAEKYYKTYETYVGDKTTETFLESFILLYTRGVGCFCRLMTLKLCRTISKKIM